MTTLDSPDANRPESNRSDSITMAGDQGVDQGNAVEVVRSEQRLDVGTVVAVSGRAVLRRFVVTETVTQSFQVRHEEFRVDHEPLSDGSRADDEHMVVDERAFAGRFVETVLHREVPVVTMRVEPTERVRVHVDTVTDQVQVSEDVARERVDVEVPDQVDASRNA